MSALELEIVHSQSSYLSVRMEDILSLGGKDSLAHLLQLNSFITDFHLQWHEMGSDIRHIAEMLKMNSRLQLIHLGNNGIGGEGAREVAEALKVNSVQQAIIWSQCDRR